MCGKSQPGDARSPILAWRTDPTGEEQHDHRYVPGQHRPRVCRFAGSSAGSQPTHGPPRGGPLDGDSMKRFFSFLTAAFMALATLSAHADDKRATEPEAEAMVKKAVAFYKKNGKDKALAEFNKNPGACVDRDLYVTVYTLNADSLAHIN